MDILIKGTYLTVIYALSVLIAFTIVTVALLNQPARPAKEILEKM